MKGEIINSLGIERLSDSQKRIKEIRRIYVLSNNFVPLFSRRKFGEPAQYLVFTQMKKPTRKHKWATKNLKL